MSWHVSPRALQQYATGVASEATSWSVETHLLGCDTCRARLVHALDDDVWDELRRHREALSLGGQPATVPAWARWSARRAVLRGVLGPWWAWAGLVAAVFVVMMLLGRVPAPQPGLLRTWSLPFAPLLPVGMVAGVYAMADRDPVAGMTPRGGLELVLIRTLTVLVVTVPTVMLGMAAGGDFGLAWLLPAVTLCAGALALGPSVGVERAGTGLGVLWLGAVAVAAPPAGLASAAALIQPHGATSALWAGTLLAVVVVIAVQRDRFDLPGRLS